MAELFSTSLFNDANLVSYWRLEGNSNDAKGTNTGTDTNLIYAGSAGVYGQGVALGTSSISLPTFTSATTGFSWVGWAYSTNGTQAGAFFSVGGGASHFGYGVMVAGTTQDTSGSQLLIVYPGVSNRQTGYFVPMNTWFHLGYVVNGGTAQCYVNGTAVGSTNTDTPLTPNGNPAIGALQESGSFRNKFIGNMDDVAYFSRVLGTAELFSLYQNGNGNLISFEL